MNRLPLILGLAFSLLTTPRDIVAQAGDSLGFAGPAGIYVWTGGVVVSQAHPVAGVMAHRVERRLESETVWRQLADVQAVSSADQFFARVPEAVREELRITLHQDSDAAVWNWIVTHPRADSLSRIIGNDAIRRALGIYYLDTNVNRGQRYQYRITDLDTLGRIGTSRISAPVDYPTAVVFAPMRVFRTEVDESRADLLWQILPGNHVGRVVEVYRREGLSGEFSLVDSLDALLRLGDTLVASWHDRRVSRGRTYQYYAVARDLFFNRGNPSDTATLYTITEEVLAPPSQIKVEGVDTLGLRLSWQVLNPERTATVRIYRSDRIDGTFALAAELPATSNSWLDPASPLMLVTYYRLSVTGPRQNESPLSAASFGYLRSPFRPSQPQGLGVEWANGRARLSWSATRSGDLRGFLIYRLTGPVIDWDDSTQATPIGDLIAVGDSSFVDSVSAFQAGQTYSYSIRAVNSSEQRSPWADPAFLSVPVANLTPGIPSGLNAVPDGSTVVLSWQEPTDGTIPLQSYRLIRSSPGTPDREFRTPVNRWVDSSATRGNSYTYTVMAVGIDSRLGRASSAATVLVPQLYPLPPGNVRASAIMPAGVTIVWDEVEDAELRVRIYRYVTGAAPVLLGEVAASTLGYQDNTATAGIRWRYRVVSFRDGVEGVIAAEVSVLR